MVFGTKENSHRFCCYHIQFGYFNCAFVDHLLCVLTFREFEHTIITKAIQNIVDGMSLPSALCYKSTWAYYIQYSLKFVCSSAYGSVIDLNSNNNTISLTSHVVCLFFVLLFSSLCFCCALSLHFLAFVAFYAQNRMVSILLATLYDSLSKQCSSSSRAHIHNQPI